MRNKPDESSDRNKDKESSALVKLAKDETTHGNDHAVEAPAVRRSPWNIIPSKFEVEEEERGWMAGHFLQQSQRRGGA